MLSCNPWDLGSIPRSPIFHNEFCFNMIPCSTYPQGLPCSFKFVLATRPIRSIQWSEAADHHMHRSTPSYTSQESPHGLAFNGPNCWQLTSKRANKPTMFASFSLFTFSLIYFNYIICFILIP